MIQDNGDGTLTYKGLPKAALDAIDALRNPYGVPTGSVPRVGFLREDHSMKIKGNPLPPLQPPDPIAQAVDDYLLMERKARAWDEVRAHIVGNLRLRHLDADCGEILDLMDSLVHPAQEPSKR